MFLGLVRLLRLSNSLPASLLVCLGARLAGAALTNQRLWLAVAAMWCITAFGYVSNDLTDQAEDRVNKPDRPLPTGVVTPRQALLVTCLLAVAALLLSAPLGLAPVTIAAAVLLLLLLYNRRLKGASGVGNLLIAGLAAGALLPGVVAVYGWQWAPFRKLFPAVLALALFIFAREVVKTLEDRTGDGLVGKRTIALTLGIGGTVRLVAALAFLLCCTVTLLFCWWGYSWTAVVLMSGGVALPLCWSAAYLAPDAALSRVRTCLALLKGSYFVGLVALWLA